MSVVSTEFGMESDDEEAVEMVEVESFRAGPTEERAPASGDALSWAADFLSKLNLEVILDKLYLFIYFRSLEFFYLLL